VEKKVNKKVNKKPIHKNNNNKSAEKLDRNGEVIVPPFRVKIIEQLCADPAKLEMILPVLAKYDCSIAMYV
jgi:hypothetical protein